MAQKFQFKGETAVITGAGSGIGAALARALAERGTNLALTDVNAGALVRIQEETAATGVHVTGHPMDISAPEAPAHLAQQVKDLHAGCSLVFNNAGIAVGGTFDRIRAEDFDQVMAVNFEAVVRMSRAFMPMLKSAFEARLVNISSIFGVVAPPGQTAYSASKFAVRGFSMALAHELEGTRVGVTVVHPGGVRTRIAEDAIKPLNATNAEINQSLDQARKALVMPPEKAAEIILRGVADRKRRVFVGRDAHTLMWIERVLPTRYMGFLKKRLGP